MYRSISIAGMFWGDCDNQNHPENYRYGLSPSSCREAGAWKGEKGVRGSRLFPLSIFQRALTIFLIFAIFIGIFSGSLWGESVVNTAYPGYPGDSIHAIVISPIICFEPHRIRSVSIIIIFSIAWTHSGASSAVESSWTVGSLTEDVSERRTSTGSGRFAFLSSYYAYIFRGIPL